MDKTVYVGPEHYALMRLVAQSICLACFPHLIWPCDGVALDLLERIYPFWKPLTPKSLSHVKEFV